MGKLPSNFIPLSNKYINQARTQTQKLKPKNSIVKNYYENLTNELLLSKNYLENIENIDNIDNTYNAKFVANLSGTEEILSNILKAEITFKNYQYCCTEEDRKEILKNAMQDKNIASIYKKYGTLLINHYSDQLKGKVEENQRINIITKMQTALEKDLKLNGGKNKKYSKINRRSSKKRRCSRKRRGSRRR